LPVWENAKKTFVAESIDGLRASSEWYFQWSTTAQLSGYVIFIGSF